MSQLTSIRLRPTDTNFLDTQSFDSGSIFYDSVKNTLVIMDGRTRGGYELLRADLTNATTGLGVEVSQTPPSNARSGSLWLDTDSGELLIYLNDGDSSQWIQPSTPSFSTGGSSYSLPTATTSMLGGVRVDGSTITINNGIITAAGSGTTFNASNLTLGTVPVARLGASGTPSVSTYLRGDNSWASISSLGVATAQTAGIVKPGTGLSVSQDGTLNVTGSIALSNIDGLSFSRGVAVSEFSSDSSMTDNASDTVPVESAVRGYIDRRLGYTHTGAPVPNNTAIPAGGLFRYATEEFVNDLIDNLSAGSTTLSTLTDVNVTGVTDGQVLKYSTSQSKWIAAADLTGASGTGISLSDLSVSVATASGSGSLSYNNTSGVFTFIPAVAGVTSVAGTGTVNGLTLTGTVTSTGNLTLGGTLSNVSLATAVTGTLPVANGGTGTTIPSLVAGTNVTVTGTWPNQTINSTASGGATTFSGLSDATSAGLTVDELYLPAITKLTVTANGSSAYLFDQYTGNNPTVYVTAGTTIAFDLGTGALSSHPFLIRFSGANYNTGLTHVTGAGVVTTGASAQGKTSGTLYWKIPADISGAYGYLCGNHGSMIGTITINPAAVFASPTFTGTVTMSQSVETFTSPSISANAVTLNFNNGAIFSLASNSAAITANYTNIPVTAGQVIATTLIITQGATAYIPSAVTINTVSQTIKWQGGATPTGNANKTDIVSFTFVCNGTTTPSVIGSLSTYG